MKYYLIKLSKCIFRQSVVCLCFACQVIEEPVKEETKKVGVRFAPEPEMEDIQTRTEVNVAVAIASVHSSLFSKLR